MEIIIDNRSGKPIYDQIYSKIKSEIISGHIEADSPLPSIRNLAKDLGISVITTKRAYDELEKEGFVYTVTGKGFYVSPMNSELLREENLKKIEAHIFEAVKISRYCNLSKDELIEMIRYIEED